MQITIHNIDKQQGFKVQYRELHSVSCNKTIMEKDLGKQSLFCTPETINNTILKIKYTSIIKGNILMWAEWQSRWEANIDRNYITS